MGVNMRGASKGGGGVHTCVAHRLALPRELMGERGVRRTRVRRGVLDMNRNGERMRTSRRE